MSTYTCYNPHGASVLSLCCPHSPCPSIHFGGGQQHQATFLVGFLCINVTVCQIYNIAKYISLSYVNLVFKYVISINDKLSMMLTGYSRMSTFSWLDITVIVDDLQKQTNLL